MTDDSSVELYGTPKLNIDGDGDGIKTVTTRKRVPVPSSRKFNARTPSDKNMRLKLEKLVTEMQEREKTPKAQNCLSKSQSVAEITPSKSKPKKKPTLKLETLNSECQDDSLSLNVTLHATPRPLDGPTEATTPSASRLCTRDWAACKVYRRLLLCVWRRYKTRLQVMSESNGRQQNQINQLEVQVDFLKGMRNSECEKRNEALNECQKMKKKVEVLELANNNLIEEMKNLQEELTGSKKNLKIAKYDLKNCSSQLVTTQDLLKKRKGEIMDLIVKMANQEQEISNQNSTILDLEQTLKTAEKNLHNMESNLKGKQDEFDNISHQLEDELKLNKALKDEVSNLKSSKSELEKRSRNLEDELEAYVSHVIELKDENISIRTDLEVVDKELTKEKKKTWYKNTKELALLSLSALQKIAEIMLPIYHKY